MYSTFCRFVSRRVNRDCGMIASSETLLANVKTRIQFRSKLPLLRRAYEDRRRHAQRNRAHRAGQA